MLLIIKSLISMTLVAQEVRQIIQNLFGYKHLF